VPRASNLLPCRRQYYVAGQLAQLQNIGAQRMMQLQPYLANVACRATLHQGHLGSHGKPVNVPAGQQQARHAQTGAYACDLMHYWAVHQGGGGK
jgi:hypothetical protein